MKKNGMNTTANNSRQGDNERQRIKTSPTAQSMGPVIQHRNQQTIMVFSSDIYPFSNNQNSSTQLLKTIVNLSLTTEKLQKIIKLSHPNIIGLRKISKCNSRQTYTGKKPKSYYSFFYENIPYSLKTLTESYQDNPSLLNIIFSLNLKTVLRSVVEYLQQAGIFYTAKVQDIGVSNDGVIKIYIPPIIVFESSYDQSVYRSINALSEWWDSLKAAFSKNQFKKQKIIIQPPKLSDNGDLQFDEPSMQQSIERQLGQLLGDDNQEDLDEAQKIKVNQLKQSTNSHVSQLSKIGSIQLEKIKKIDQQVKYIRQRLNQKTKKRHKQSDNTEQKKDNARAKSNLNIFESDRLVSKERVEQKPIKQDHNYFARQKPIQQNINCINIYNHNTGPISPNALVNIPSYIPQPPTRQQHYYDPNLDPEFFRDHDDDCSQDTYDIQFESQFQLPNACSSNNFRHTLFPPIQRELSQYSEHCHKKGKDKRDKDFNSNVKHHVNQVYNKNITQSAGPLQFKSFVNKFIKPQFLAKKSNIYEDPCQDDSERSASPIKKQEKKVHHHQQLKKKVGNKSNRTVSDEKSLKKRYNRNLNMQTPRNELQKIVKGKFDIKRINSQNEFNVTHSKVFTQADSQIEEKVKRALQKTKHAIQLLNRVKSCKNTGVKMFTSKQQ